MVHLVPKSIIYYPLKGYNLTTENCYVKKVGTSFKTKVESNHKFYECSFWAG